MAKAGAGKTKRRVAASVGGRRRGQIRPGVFRVDVPKGQGADAARRLKQNRSVAAVEDDVRFLSAEVAPTDPEPLVPSDEADRLRRRGEPRRRSTSGASPAAP